MNGYICTKALNLGGVEYLAGQAIPEDAVLPSRVRALIRLGYIAQVDGPVPVGANGVAPVVPAAPAVITLPIGQGEDAFELQVTPDSISTAVVVVQLSAGDAVKAIKDLDDDDALTLIHALDSRKTVKDAATERHAKLSESTNEGSGEDEEDADGEDEGEGGE